MPTTPAVNVEALRPDIQDALEEFDVLANRAGMVGLKIFPRLPVDEVAGNYPIIRAEDVLVKEVNDLRGEDGTYNTLAGKFTKGTWACEEHGLAELVGKREKHKYSKWIQMEIMAARRVQTAVLQNHERRVITAVEAISNSTNINTVWTNHSSATPVDDVNTAAIKIRNRTGVIPNALCLEWEVFRHLRLNAQVISALNSNGINETDQTKITPAMLALAFDLEEVIVSGSMQNTAAEGKTASLSPLWTKTKALLFRKSDSPEMREPRLGNTFEYTEDQEETSMSGDGITNVETYYSPDRRGDMVRYRMDTDEKVVYDACGELLNYVAA